MHTWRDNSLRPSDAYICISKLTITGSDNGLSPVRHQAIIWTNAGIMLIGPLGTNFSENLIEILIFSFTKMRLKVLSAKWLSFCFCLNVLTHWSLVICISVHHQFREYLFVAKPLCCCIILFNPGAKFNETSIKVQQISCEMRSEISAEAIFSRPTDLIDPIQKINSKPFL